MNLLLSIGLLLLVFKEHSSSKKELSRDDKFIFGRDSWLPKKLISGRLGKFLTN